jgi:hypothetical protein
LCCVRFTRKVNFSASLVLAFCSALVAGAIDADSALGNHLNHHPGSIPGAAHLRFAFHELFFLASW